MHRNAPQSPLRTPWIQGDLGLACGRAVSSPAHSLQMRQVVGVKAEDSPQPAVSRVSPGTDLWSVGRVSGASVPRALGGWGRRAGRGGAGGCEHLPPGGGSVGTSLAPAPATALFPQEGVGAGHLGVPRASKWPSCPLSWG